MDAEQNVEGLKAVHLNLPILFPPPIEGEPSPEEKAAIAQDPARRSGDLAQEPVDLLADRFPEAGRQLVLISRAPLTRTE